MRHSDVEPFIGKRVTVQLESGLYAWGTLRYWDGAEVADRRLFLDSPPQTKGIWVTPTMFYANSIVENGIRPFPEPSS